MRILAPLTQISEIEALIEGGADELYCGVLSSTWKKHFSAVGSPNWRTSSKANLSGFKDLKHAVELAETHSTPIFLTLNAQTFSRSQLTRVFEEAEKAVKAGVKGLIIANPVLIRSISKSALSVDIHISTISSVFNSKALAFYQDLGASRVVLPKELDLSEISDIIEKSSDIEIEVLVLNGLCHNSEGFCTFQHRMRESALIGWPSPIYESALRILGGLPRQLRAFLFFNTPLKNSTACLLPYKVKRLTGTSEAALSAASSTPKAGNHLNSCAVCAIPRLINAGVDTIKLDGRFFSTEKKLSDLAFVKSCVDFAVSNPSSEDFQSFAIKQYQRSHGFPCQSSNCYPSVEVS